MMAAPMTYSINGTQYVAIITGIGGGNGNDYLPGMAAYTYGNQGRLVVFKLGGGEVPRRPEIPREENLLKPPPVPRRGTDSQIAQGSKLYIRNCAKCHSNIDGRGSGIPDLRLMDDVAHAQFNDILLRGTLADKGMGDFSELLNEQQVESLHAYLIDWAWSHFEKQSAVGEWHKAPDD